MSNYPTNNLIPEQSPSGELSEVVRLLAGRYECFRARDLAGQLSRKVDPSDVLSILTNDPRFISSGIQSDGDVYFVSDAALFKWYTYLNLYLAQRSLCRLSEEAMLSAWHALVDESSLDIPLTPFIGFGRRFGLVCEDPQPNSFVFPLANLVSCLLPQYLSTIAEVLEGLVDAGRRRSTFSQTLAQAIEAGFKTCSDKRTVDILKCREGLTAEGKMTLEQIAAGTKVTRERIRQIETKAWRSLKDPKSRIRPHFLSAFLVNMMRNHGSMIVSQSSPEASMMLFLAKYLDIESVELEHTGLVILGNSSKSLLSLNVSKRGVPDQFPSYLDKDFIVVQLASADDLCLSVNDTSILAAAVSDKRMQQLDKGQCTYLALRELKEPAHFSKVTEQYNSMFPDDKSSEKAVHGILSRKQYGIVWVGSKGVYGLKAWGNKRPTQSLYDTATQIVIRKYMETGQPVPESFIASELSKIRHSLDPNSLVFVTHNNPDLRVVVGRAFVPLDVVNMYVGDGSGKSMSTSSTKVNDPYKIDELPIPFICGPEFLGKQKEEVLSLDNKFSIRDLKRLIHHGIGRTGIANTFNTMTRVEQADKAIRRFTNAITKWESGERRDSRLMWIVPDKFISSDLKIITAKNETLLKALRNHDDMQLRGLEFNPTAQHWLPFLSLEFINVVKKLHSGDFPVLQMMLLKASRYAKGPQIPGPWDPGFPQTLQRLCLYSLYQFAPTQQALRLLVRLRRAGCTNIGHLVAFHPQAYNLVRTVDSKVWIKLAITLKQAT